MQGGRIDLRPSLITGGREGFRLYSPYTTPAIKVENIPSRRLPLPLFPDYIPYIS